jgi:hypothetical protein
MAKNQDSGNEFQDKIHFTIQGSAYMTNVTIVVAAFWNFIYIRPPPDI